MGFPGPRVSTDAFQPEIVYFVCSAHVIDCFGCSCRVYLVLMGVLAQGYVQKDPIC